MNYQYPYNQSYTGSYNPAQASSPQHQQHHNAMKDKSESSGATNTSSNSAHHQHHQHQSVPKAYNFQIPYNPPSVSLKEVPSQNFSHPSNPYLFKEEEMPLVRDGPKIEEDEGTSIESVISKKKEMYHQHQSQMPGKSSNRGGDQSAVESSENKDDVATDERKSGDLGDNEFEKELEFDGMEVANVDLPILSMKREYATLRIRYPNLHIPSDFTKVEFFWNDFVDKNMFNTDIKRGQIIFCDNFMGKLKEKSENEPIATLDKMTKYNAKVMFGIKDFGNKHLWDDFKFLIGKKDRSGIFALGGSYVKSLDGGNPELDETMKVTAIRCVKSMCGLDLSGVKDWMKFMKIHYHRPSEVIFDVDYPEMIEKTTIFYLPDILSLFPSITEYGEIVKNRRDSILSFEEKGVIIPDQIKKIPKNPSIFCVTQKAKLEKNQTTMMISLDGVLDYNREDKMEKTFEVSLFAEGFKEMLQYQNGVKILEFLKSTKEVVGEKRKREREKNNKEDSTEKEEGRMNKRPKVEITVESVDDVKNSFSHFDRQSKGSVRVSVLEDVFLTLGKEMSKGEVRSVLNESNIEKDSFLYDYSKLEDFFSNDLLKIKEEEKEPIEEEEIKEEKELISVKKEEKELIM